MCTVPTAIHLHSRSFQVVPARHFPAGKAPESNSFYTRRLVGRLFAQLAIAFELLSSLSQPGQETYTGLFRFKPSSGAWVSFQPPGVLMFLPPFHGHAEATVSTI
ncbi:hypothetical protein [Paraburkholderia sp. BCC1886]|uniref:hypothetical protein n=1 Tax=Paraburkholderia sp. BCC1886 TaxID=2562670 RepID=UPI00118273DD|nr:hypothetical protein [Paraburkholderia sp. BCC1886]